MNGLLRWCLLKQCYITRRCWWRRGRDLPSTLTSPWEIVLYILYIFFIKLSVNCVLYFVLILILFHAMWTSFRFERIQIFPLFFKMPFLKWKQTCYYYIAYLSGHFDVIIVSKKKRWGERTLSFFGDHFHTCNPVL